MDQNEGWKKGDKEKLLRCAVRMFIRLYRKTLIVSERIEDSNTESITVDTGKGAEPFPCEGRQLCLLDR